MNSKTDYATQDSCLRVPVSVGENISNKLIEILNLTPEEHSLYEEELNISVKEDYLQDAEQHDIQVQVRVEPNQVEKITIESESEKLLGKLTNNELISLKQKWDDANNCGWSNSKTSEEKTIKLKKEFSNFNEYGFFNYLYANRLKLYPESQSIMDNSSDDNNHKPQAIYNDQKFQVLNKRFLKEYCLIELSLVLNFSKNELYRLCDCSFDEVEAKILQMVKIKFDNWKKSLPDDSYNLF